MTTSSSSSGYGAAVSVRRVTDGFEVERAAELFDDSPLPAATERFLNSPDHHLLLAYDESDFPIRMITGVETTHPDKGTEMFVYELGVDESRQRQGIATQLVQALESLARARGCYGMWVAVEPGNEAALAAYRRAGAHGREDAVIYSWDFDTG